MTTDFPWLDTLQGAAAIDVADRCGLLADIAGDGDISARPALLENLLIGAGVVVREDSGLAFTKAFMVAWRADSAAIVARASFIRRAAADVAMGLDELVFDLPAFMKKSATFRLFRYDMAEDTTPAHLKATRPWVDYVEALSRSESPHLVPIIDIRDGDRILEIGGNTGVMSAALIAAYSGVTACIFDLPAVCHLGRERNNDSRLEFVSGDARKLDALDRFHGVVDVVLFKSVLHDWPAEDAEEMLVRAMKLLAPGGRIIVCERDAFGPDDAIKNCTHTVTNMVFSPFYRDSQFYLDIMSRRGLAVTQKSVQLDMTFHATIGTCK